MGDEVWVMKWEGMRALSHNGFAWSRGGYRGSNGVDGAGSPRLVAIEGVMSDGMTSVQSVAAGEIDRCSRCVYSIYTSVDKFV